MFGVVRNVSRVCNHVQLLFRSPSIGAPLVDVEGKTNQGSHHVGARHVISGQATVHVDSPDKIAQSIDPVGSAWVVPDGEVLFAFAHVDLREETYHGCVTCGKRGVAHGTVAHHSKEALMPLIRQEEIYPVAETPWAQAIEAVATAAIAKDDIVILDGVTGVIPKASPAKADDNVVGQLFVAAGKAAAAGDKLYLLPYRIVSGVDTSAGAVGDPVYLSAATAGAITLTEPTGADEIPVIVGVVLSVDASGVVRLDPGKEVRGLMKIGTVVIPSGASAPASDPTLGPNFAGGTVIATFATNPTANVSVFAAMNGNDVDIRTSGNVGADTTVNFVVYSQGL